jgi:tetratricopeptide (TPR) repeat protein
LLLRRNFFILLSRTCSFAVSIAVFSGILVRFHSFDQTRIGSQKTTPTFHTGMTETVEQRIQSLEKHLSSQPRSPLFAQLASYYLDAGKAREALDLCDKGLAIYPFYSTGHLIKGKALLGLNMTAEARREFELVQSSFPILDSLTRVLRNLPSDDVGIIAVSAAQPKPPETQIPEPQPTAGKQPAEPITAEANPDQWLSQFTDAAAATSATAEEPTQTVQQAETPALETSETFSFTGETTEQAPAEAPVQSENEFGVGTPQEPSATTPEVRPQEVALTGESFQDFAERKRGELFGLENTSTLEDYLGSDQPTAEVVTESSESPTVPETAEIPVQDPFAAVTDQFVETPTETAQETVEVPATDPFAALTQQFEETPAETAPENIAETPESVQAPIEDPFAALTQQFEETPTESIAEAPESTQTPTEDSLTALTQQFEETPAPTEEAPAAMDESRRGKNDIQDLADKLKNAKKITPIIDLTERTAVPPSESETPSGTGFVTPTLAEIYAKQGWYDDAIKAYKMLAVSKPAEKDKFEKRIKELEELKKQQQSG